MYRVTQRKHTHLTDRQAMASLFYSLNILFSEYLFMYLAFDTSDSQIK